MVDKIKISGVAVREGISRNFRKYTAKELHKFAPTLQGKPILKDHEGMTDNVIGIVEKSQSIDNGKLVTYEGWVKEDGTGLLEKIKDGRIKEVSIGAIAGKVVQEHEDDEYVIPMNMEAMELSTTPVPGNRGTSLYTDEKLKLESKEEIEKMIQNYEKENLHLSQDNKHIIQKEDNMEAKNIDKSQLEKVDYSKELNELKEALEESKKSNESLEKSRKEDAILRYNEKCEVKSIKPKDVSSMTLETIKALTEMAEDVPEPEAEAPAEEEPTKDEPAEESEEDKKAEESKKPAKLQSKEIVEDVEKDIFEGYVISSETGIDLKSAFYKFY